MSSNPDFQNLPGSLRHETYLNKGYKGLLIDDVNLAFRIFERDIETSVPYGREHA